MTYEQPLQGRGRGPSPVLFLGIIIVISPFLANVIHKNLPGWIYGVGIFVILIGAFLSVIRQA